MSWAILVSTRVAADVAALVVVKGTLVLFLAASAAWGLRGRSAALRHRAWTVGLLVLLGLPVVAEWMPPWTISGTALLYPAETPLVGIEAIETSTRQGSPGTSPDLRGRGETRRSGAAAATDPTVEMPPPTTAETSGGGVRSSLPSASLLLITWWIGVLVLGIGTVADLVRAHVLRWQAEPAGPGDPLVGLLDEERRRLGVTRRVDLLMTDADGFAATLGPWRPAILLGRDVACLPCDQLRAVLLHELAHVRRYDFLTNLLAGLATMLYWPNPLVWWARRAAGRERERACDDEVINQGIESPHYARVLLAFAHSRPALSPAMRSSVGLRLSATKSRLLAILDSGVDRDAGGRAMPALAGMAFLALVLPLGGLDIFQSVPGTGSSADLVAALSHPQPAVRAQAARTLGRRDATPARLELESLLDDASSEVRLAAMGTLHQLADPASLGAMARVLERPFDEGRGEHGFVLKLAMLTLGRLDSEDALRVLEAQLDRPVAPLRWLALETILSMPSHYAAAEPYLRAFAASDASARNRRLAEEALREILESSFDPGGRAPR